MRKIQLFFIRSIIRNISLSSCAFRRSAVHSDGTGNRLLVILLRRPALQRGTGRPRSVCAPGIFASTDAGSAAGHLNTLAPAMASIVSLQTLEFAATRYAIDRGIFAVSIPHTLLAAVATFSFSFPLSSFSPMSLLPQLVLNSSWRVLEIAPNVIDHRPAWWLAGIARRTSPLALRSSPFIVQIVAAGFYHNLSAFRPSRDASVCYH